MYIPVQAMLVYILSKETKGAKMALGTILAWLIPYLSFLSALAFTTPVKALMVYAVTQLIALILWAIAEQKVHESWLNKREIEYQIWARESERRYGGKLPEKPEDFYDDPPSRNVFKFMFCDNSRRHKQATAKK